MYIIMFNVHAHISAVFGLMLSSLNYLGISASNVLKMFLNIFHYLLALFVQLLFSIRNKLRKHKDALFNQELAW